MTASNEPVGDMAADDYANADYNADYNADLNADNASRRTIASATERPADAAAARPKITLAAGVTCPECGHASKAEWMTKSRQGDAYAATVFCERCGALIAVWTGHVDARVVARRQDI